MSRPGGLEDRGGSSHNTLKDLMLHVSSAQIPPAATKRSPQVHLMNSVLVRDVPRNAGARTVKPSFAGNLVID